MIDPTTCLFHDEHMWIHPDGAEGTLGITPYAQEKLGEVSLLDLPAPGTAIRQGEAFGTVESAKVASDLIAPVNGEIIATNPKLSEDPWLVNDEPFGNGWIVRVRIDNPDSLSELKSHDEYLKFVES